MPNMKMIHQVVFKLQRGTHPHTDRQTELLKTLTGYKPTVDTVGKLNEILIYPIYKQLTFFECKNTTKGCP